MIDIVRRAENTEHIFLHWLEDLVTGECSRKGGYSEFVYLKGYVGFTAYYSGKEGIMTADEFCKMLG